MAWDQLAHPRMSLPVSPQQEALQDPDICRPLAAVVPILAREPALPALLRGFLRTQRRSCGPCWVLAGSVGTPRSGREMKMHLSQICHTHGP